MVKDKGLQVIPKELDPDILGIVEEKSLILNSKYNSKADIKYVIAILLTMHTKNMHGFLHVFFKYNGEFIDNIMQDAADLILPKDMFFSGDLITYKKQKLDMNIINLQRMRWQAYMA